MGHPLVHSQSITVGLHSSRTVTFGLMNRGITRAVAFLVIFLIEKLRPRLWAISRSSRKYHDFSK